MIGPVTPAGQAGDRPAHRDQALPGKGETLCNRTACQDDIAGDRWWNTSTRAWYCRGCAARINGASVEFREPILCFPEDGLPASVGPGFALPPARPAPDGATYAAVPAPDRAPGEPDTYVLDLPCTAPPSRHSSYTFEVHVANNREPRIPLLDQYRHNDPEVAKVLQAERRRRKAAEYAKRQPKPSVGSIDKR